jgi:trk system potassium uptake protein TrkH
MLRILPVARTLGLLLILFSTTFTVPMLVSLYYHDGEIPHFVASMAVTAALGLALWFPARNHRAALRAVDGFVIVSFFWIGLGMLGALPLVFGPHLSFVDATFEAISGFTTTGATVITGLDHLPRSILYYRSQLQWLGGAGVMVLAVAILPLLGIGGMQLFRAETPGPFKDEKLTPRIIHTARALWLIYVGLTAACALAFHLAGMSVFDAICHSFSALSTGGFSTHDASFTWFHSPTIEAICSVFMLLGAMNFAVHFTAWRHRSVLQYFRDSEVRTFLIIVAVIMTGITIALRVTGQYPTLLTSLRYTTFEVASIITSTGFGITNFTVWPLGLPVFLMLISFIGGCAGSTAGGMKVIRILLVSKQSSRELTRLVHPRMVRPIKVGGRVINERALEAVWGFFAVYIVTFLVLMMLLLTTGTDPVTAFSAIATCINNLGPGLGKVAANFQSMTDFGKIIASAAMLLGRLEIFTLLVLLSPAFWRR